MSDDTKLLDALRIKWDTQLGPAFDKTLEAVLKPCIVHMATPAGTVAAIPVMQFRQACQEMHRIFRESAAEIVRSLQIASQVTHTALSELRIEMGPTTPRGMVDIVVTSPDTGQRLVNSIKPEELRLGLVTVLTARQYYGTIPDTK